MAKPAGRGQEIPPATSPRTSPSYGTTSPYLPASVLGRQEPSPSPEGLGDQLVPILAAEGPNYSSTGK